MSKYFVLILLIPVGAFAAIFAGEMGYSVEKQRAFPASYRIEEKYGEAIRKLEDEAREQEVAVEDGQVPVVEITQTEFNVGVMEPDTDGQHEFVLKNVGTAPLKLANGGKTCFCVEFGVSREIVPPGEEATVTLGWNSRFPTQEYRHGASIRTNDPNNPMLKFRIVGEVATEFGCEGNLMVFDKVWPGREETGEVVILSELWDDFEIETPQVSNSNFKTQLIRVEDEELPLRSKAAYRLVVTTPTDLPRGNFQEEVALVGRATAGEYQGKERELKILLQGYVAKRITFFGKELSDQGRIDFGVVTGTQGKTSQVFVRVNDEDTHLKLSDVEVQPEFIKVELKPVSAEKGTYQLTFEIPPHAPQGTFTADTAGHVHLEFDHPRIEPIDFGIHAVILP